MTTSTDSVTRAALALPAADRAALAHALIVSIESRSVEDPGEAAAAWEAEIRGRAERYRRGAAVLSTWQDVEASVAARQDPRAS